MNDKFNQQKYIQEYNKKHYVRFVADLKQEEMKLLNELLKKQNISKAQFIRNAIIDLQRKSSNH